MYIDYEVADKIATITLNRPEAANAQNGALLDELDAAWTKAAEDPDVAVIVLRAEGNTSPPVTTSTIGGRLPRRSPWNGFTGRRPVAIWSTRCVGAMFRSRRSRPSRGAASRAGCCCAGRAT